MWEEKKPLDAKAFSVQYRLFGYSYSRINLLNARRFPYVKMTLKMFFWDTGISSLTWSRNLDLRSVPRIPAIVLWMNLWRREKTTKNDLNSYENTFPLCANMLKSWDKSIDLLFLFTFHSVCTATKKEQRTFKTNARHKVKPKCFVFKLIKCSPESDSVIWWFL